MPTFSPGVTKTAVAIISNPTAKSFSYTAELYLGLPKKASSGKVPFYLIAGESKPVRFTVVMPSIAGTYPVYLDVFADSQLVGAYQATDVEITIPGLVKIRLTNPPITAGYWILELYHRVRAGVASISYDGVFGIALDWAFITEEYSVDVPLGAFPLLFGIVIQTYSRETIAIYQSIRSDIAETYIGDIYIASGGSYIFDCSERNLRRG